MAEFDYTSQKSCCSNIRKCQKGMYSSVFVFSFVFVCWFVFVFVFYLVFQFVIVFSSTFVFGGMIKYWLLDGSNWGEFDYAFQKVAAGVSENVKGGCIWTETDKEFIQNLRLLNSRSRPV